MKGGPIAAALASRDELGVRYAAFRAAAHAALGPRVTAMVRQAVAQVHGVEGVDEAELDAELRAALKDWRHSDRFTSSERTWLAYAERIPFEHTAIVDDEAAAVVEALGEPSYVALSVVAALADVECRAMAIDLPAVASA